MFVRSLPMQSWVEIRWGSRCPVSWGPLLVLLPHTWQIWGMDLCRHNAKQSQLPLLFLPIHPKVNLRLLAAETTFYFSLNCCKALALFLSVKTQRPTSDYILLFLSSQVFVGTKNAKGSTHILNKESNFGNNGLHKWKRWLGKMPVGMVLMLRVKLCWGILLCV